MDTNNQHSNQQTALTINPANLPEAFNGLEISPRARNIQAISKNIPKNDYNLPEYFLRADLIPHNLETFTYEDRQNTLSAATVMLDYSQGYPILPNGEPFWSMLPAESPEAFRAFVKYLDCPRDISQAEGLAAPVRQFHMIAKEVGMKTADLLTLAMTYFWTFRAQAYDAYVLAAHTKQKEYKLLDVENMHFKRATKIIESAATLLESKLTSLAGNMDEAKLKELLDVMVKMAQLQRISLGASAFGSNTASKDAPPVGQSIEVHLQQIAKNSGQTGKTIAEGQDLANEIYDDTETLEQAQQMIIKLNTKANPRIAHNAAALNGYEAGKVGKGHINDL